MSRSAVYQQAVPARYAPDRYADAVRARRRELHDQLLLLTPGHRAGLRDSLLPARAAAAAEAADALAELAREVDLHLHRGGHRALPPMVAAAVGSIGYAAHRRWSGEARGAVRRLAADRGLPLPPRWPVLPPVPPPAPAAPPPRPVGLVDVLTDTGAWRLAVLPLAAAPLTGLAGPAVLLPAVGAGVLVLCAALRARRAAAERARARTWCAELLAGTRTRIDAELG
ncbi:MAG: hypothetical protein L0H64_20595, partial [Pseudonocardia sp.]|nr:hypothetical protein [Pseudonocardia sp.]